MAAVERNNTVWLGTTWAEFSRATSPPICRCSRPRRWSCSSISRPPTRFASPSHCRYPGCEGSDHNHPYCLHQWGGPGLDGRADQCTEFVSRAHPVGLSARPHARLLPTGQVTDNALVESFNDKFRSGMFEHRARMRRSKEKGWIGSNAGVLADLLAVPTRPPSALL